MFYSKAEEQLAMDKFKHQNSNILFSKADQPYTDFADYDLVVGDEASPVCSENSWHTHAGIQILIVIDGCGYYQEKGKSIQVLCRGDVVFVLPNVEHWHVADLKSEFTDVSISCPDRNEIVTWLQRAPDRK